MPIIWQAILSLQQGKTDGNVLTLATMIRGTLASAEHSGSALANGASSNKRRNSADVRRSWVVLLQAVLQLASAPLAPEMHFPATNYYLLREVVVLLLFFVWSAAIPPM